MTEDRIVAQQRRINMLAAGLLRSSSGFYGKLKSALAEHGTDSVDKLDAVSTGPFLAWIEQCYKESTMEVQLPRSGPSRAQAALHYFSFAHLPEHLQEASRPFAELANGLMLYPDCEQRDVAMQKLLEAKDAAVRAKLQDGSS